MNLKIKIITGYRLDQQFSVDASEAHKAYFLFFNPSARTVFNSGLALKGEQIQQIVPDYQGTMGWNPTYVLTSDDWNEIYNRGVDKRLQLALSLGKELAPALQPADLGKRLSDVAITHGLLKEPQ